jgi:hypothetical protein
MTTKTKIVPSNSGKPQAPSGGTGGYANSRSITNDKTRPKDIGGGTPSTYYANSRAITGGTTYRRNTSLGPTSYTNFVISKKGKKQ